MSTNTYFDREDALDYHMSAHVDESPETADAILTDEGFCQCCGVDYTGLERDTTPADHQESPLDPHPWTPGMDGDDPEADEGKVDFDDDEGCTIATVRVTRLGNGYAVHIDQLSDLDNILIVHTNE